MAALKERAVEREVTLPGKFFQSLHEETKKKDWKAVASSGKRHRNRL